MYRILVYGLGKEYDKHVNLLKAGELLGKFCVKGVTRSNGWIYKHVDGYPFIPVEEIGWQDYDIFVIAAEMGSPSYADTRKVVLSKGISENKIIPVAAFSIPYFDLDKYMEISDMSIFALNCWGGLTYHSLHLPFRSPLINMFMNEYEYIKMMGNLRWYMEQPVTFSYWGDGVHGGKYPVGRLGDVLLHFKHASKFEDALADWNRRKERINYDKIYAMMFTQKTDVAELFDKLPYNKVCFTPFKNNNIRCAHYIAGGGVLNDTVNSISKGIIKDYDALDLLLGIDNNKRIVVE